MINELSFLAITGKLESVSENIICSDSQFMIQYLSSAEIVVNVHRLQSIPCFLGMPASIISVSKVRNARYGFILDKKFSYQILRYPIIYWTYKYILDLHIV